MTDTPTTITIDRARWRFGGDIPNTVREEWLTKLFADSDLRLTFIGEYPEGVL